MPSYKHNVIHLLNYMHEQYPEIYKDNGVHTDYTSNLFNALLTANNDKFLGFVNKSKDEWETSTINESDQITSDALRVKVLQKYNNMLQAKRWKQTEDPSSKSSPL